MRIAEALAEGRRRLEDAGVAEAGLEAALLAGEAVGLSRATVLAHPERQLTREEAARWSALLGGREGREPLAYLTGRQEFMGLSFAVGPGALIPRADTETLVEEAMLLLHDGMRLLDLCTGTGCIALSLLRYSNGTRAVATDLSEASLSYASRNAEALGLAARLELERVDLWPGGERGFDLIVSNPPYIATEVLKGLQPEVRDHEPRLALDGGRDGLGFYRRIIPGAGAYLSAGGWLLVEIGYDQGPAVRELFEEAGFREVRVVRDLGGLDRVVLGCWY